MKNIGFTGSIAAPPTILVPPSMPHLHPDCAAVVVETVVVDADVVDADVDADIVDADVDADIVDADVDDAVVEAVVGPTVVDVGSSI